jgi:hypothetical protein
VRPRPRATQRASGVASPLLGLPTPRVLSDRHRFTQESDQALKLMWPGAAISVVVLSMKTTVLRELDVRSGRCRFSTRPARLRDGSDERSAPTQRAGCARKGAPQVLSPPGRAPAVFSHIAPPAARRECATVVVGAPSLSWQRSGGTEHSSATIPTVWPR